MMTDDEIELHRIMGEISLELEHGAPPQKISLLRAIRCACGDDHAEACRQRYCPEIDPLKPFEEEQS